MASGSSPWAATQPTARPGPAEALRRSREGRAGNEHAAAAGAGAFEAAVEEHYAGLVRRMVLVLGDPDEARDVAQEAYLAAFRAWRSTSSAAGAAGSRRSSVSNRRRGPTRPIPTSGRPFDSSIRERGRRC